MATQIILSDALEALRSIPSASIDSVVTDPPYSIDWMRTKWDKGLPNPQIWRECLRVLRPGGYLLAFSAPRTFHRLASQIEDSGFEVRDMVNWIFAQGWPRSKQSLKPAHEPICVARKDRSSTDQNHLNIDACKIGDELRFNAGRSMVTSRCYGSYHNREYQGKTAIGRWPANVIIDEGVADDLGPKSSFFYCSKASKSERGPDNTHSTVKPIALMRYLVRLVTPVGGTVLDCFAGSGTTAISCELEHMNCIAIEREPEYVAIMERRLREVA